MNDAGEKPESITPKAIENSGETSTSLSRIIKSRGAVVALGFIISLLLLVMTAKKINWQFVQDAFASATWLPWLPLAVGAYLVGMLLRGLRLKQLVSTEASLTVLTASNIVAVGYATNNILPARLGEFARAGMLAERTGLPYALSLTVTFLERLLDGLTILSLFVLASFVTPTDQWMKTAAGIAALLFGCAIPCVMVLAFSPQLSLSLASQLSVPLGRKWHNRALALVTQITRGLSCLRDAPTALAMLVTSFLIWLTEALMFAMVMPCFKMPVSIVKATAVMAFTNLGILIPSSPGYVGPYHACCSSALSAVAQAPESIAFSYAVVVHLVFYSTVTIWGVIAMARYGLELGTTAALAWQAKPISTLQLDSESLSVITSVPTQKYVNHCFKVNSFWLAVVSASVPDGAVALPAAERADAVNYACSFTCAELGSLPSQLRILFKIGIFGFRVITILTNLMPFENLSDERRQKVLNSWAYGPIPLTRKLFKPLRSLALLAYFEHPAVLASVRARSKTLPQLDAKIGSEGVLEK